jgi:hypothetical protein
MIVEPAGSSFQTAQKTRGRAHRFFACHFLAYAQGGQSDRTLLDGGQPRDLTAEKLLEHSRLPLAWRDQRIVLGFG